MFIFPDGTLWIQLVNFAIFFVVLNFVFLRPVSAAIRKRRDYVNSVVSDYDTYQAEANKLRENAERVRAEARRDAEGQLSKARAEASNKTADLSADFAARASATMEEAHKTVAAELEAARSNEDAQVRQLASLMVDRALGEASKP
ncbi:MAG TPA: ATP synthase F0 subunit B [Candidatus Acidoferrales bacterium]|jgi:F0F1-type ATP synthase membrane subunit b/b'|nr:ATP synthase F0 subunit B [Candidatus Acidoferrales bacterium]